MSGYARVRLGSCPKCGKSRLLPPFATGTAQPLCDCGITPFKGREGDDLSPYEAQTRQAFEDFDVNLPDDMGDWLLQLQVEHGELARALLKEDPLGIRARIARMAALCRGLYVKYMDGETPDEEEGEAADDEVGADQEGGGG